MKRIMAILCVLVVSILCVTLQGCGAENFGNNIDINGSDANNTTDNIDVNSSDANNTTDNINADTGIVKGRLKATDLSIEDFVWETVKAKYKETDCYSFSLKNNSDYDVIGVEFTYKVRNDVNDSDLSVYDEFMSENEGYIDETDSPKDVVLRGSTDASVKKGDELTGLKVTVGFEDWESYDYPTDEQFGLMEPKEMQLGIVGKDNVLYFAYYDFKNGTWMLDEVTVNVDTWSKKEIAQKISKPAEDHHIVIEDEDDEFEFYSFGITPVEYSQYIEDLKNAGFEEEDSGSSWFEGKNAEGYEVELWYYSEESALEVTVSIENKA